MSKTSSSKNILVAIEPILFKTLVSDLLTEAGHNVTYSKDYQRIINAIKAESDDLDLIILDMQSPSINGLDVLKWFAENDLAGKIPVVAMTGVYEPTVFIEKLKAMGVKTFISKQLPPEQIIMRINKALFVKPNNVEEPRFRVPVAIPVDFTVDEVGNSGVLLNINEGGAFLHTDIKMPKGTFLKIKLILPGRDVTMNIKAIVKWSPSELRELYSGHGIEFTLIEERDVRPLREFILAETERAKNMMLD